MDAVVKQVDSLMSLGTLAVDGLILGLIGLIVLPRVLKLGKQAKKIEKAIEWVERHALKIAFVAALAATGGSLFYSEVAGYTPCKLCWIQRIFMYPLVPMFGLAIGKKDRKIAEYGLVLASIGGAIALYHYFLQIGVTNIAPCSAVGYSVSCSENFGLDYGYITIPMMALSAFLVIALMMVVLVMKEGEKKGIGRFLK